MTDVPNFFAMTNDDRKPHEVALDWLVEQDLKPGDEIMQGDITTALCMIDPDMLGTRRLIRKWEMARFPEVEALLELYEAKTGLIVMATHRGSYRVLAPDEIATTVFEVAVRRMRKALAMCSGKMVRASKEGASPDELQRRSSVSQYVNNVRSFMAREKRSSLNDEVV